jgi:hypothetical protein
MRLTVTGPKGANSSRMNSGSKRVLFRYTASLSGTGTLKPLSVTETRQ